MILNKTTEYALTALAFMAVGEVEPYSAEYLHEHLAIPRSYLRRLLTQLSKQGFIASSKGRRGGFVFARPLEEINLAMVINSMESSGILGNCILGHLSCREEQPCIMHETWKEIRTTMLDTLSNTTLQDLKVRSAVKNHSLKKNYSAI